MTKRICIVTGTRAEYGLLRWVMEGIRQSTLLELQLIATGIHLSPEFGLTVEAIEADGFHVDRKVEMLFSSDTAVGVTKSMGLGMIGFADALAELRPDLMLVLGDRYEIFAAAASAMIARIPIARIPIAHLHGGETTKGAFDEAIPNMPRRLHHSASCAISRPSPKSTRWSETHPAAWPRCRASGKAPSTSATVSAGVSRPTASSTADFVDLKTQQDRLRPQLERNLHRVLPVSLYGQPADMDAINAIAARHANVPVIEDAAQSFGAEYRGKKSCNLSTIGCTSFFPIKPLGCYGDGGAIFTSDDAIAQACREIRVHGQSKRYVHTRLGVGGRMCSRASTARKTSACSRSMAACSR